MSAHLSRLFASFLCYHHRALLLRCGLAEVCGVSLNKRGNPGTVVRRAEGRGLRAWLPGTAWRLHWQAAPAGVGLRRYPWRGRGEKARERQGIGALAGCSEVSGLQISWLPTHGVRLLVLNTNTQWGGRIPAARHPSTLVPLRLCEGGNRDTRIDLVNHREL